MRKKKQRETIHQGRTPGTHLLLSCLVVIVWDCPMVATKAHVRFSRGIWRRWWLLFWMLVISSLCSFICLESYLLGKHKLEFLWIFQIEDKKMENIPRNQTPSRKPQRSFEANITGSLVTDLWRPQLFVFLGGDQAFSLMAQEEVYVF